MTLAFPFLRAGAASRFGLALLLAAALSASAPFVASLALRRVTGKAEKLASLVVCFASGAPLPDARTDRPGSTDDRSPHCVLCQTLCDGAAPLAPRPGPVGVAPIQNSLPWMVADRAAPTSRPRLSHRARAPPASFAGKPPRRICVGGRFPPCGADANLGFSRRRAAM
jgi:hypothetical protein